MTPVICLREHLPDFVKHRLPAEEAEGIIHPSLGSLSPSYLCLVLTAFWSSTLVPKECVCVCVWSEVGFTVVSHPVITLKLGMLGN